MISSTMSRLAAGCLACLLAFAMVFEASAQQTITFEGLAEGQVVDFVFADGGFGPVTVVGTNFTSGQDPTVNAAIIFDSDCPGGCSGNDRDLGSPNQTFAGPGVGVGGEVGSAFENDTALGNILIVHERTDEIIGGFVANPDDETGHTAITLMFPAPVTMCSFEMIDRETQETQNVELFGVGDVLLGTFDTPATGDNGVAVVATDSGAPGSCTDGVVKMVMDHRGSGGLDNIVLVPPGGGCSLTPGFWMTHPEAWPVNSLEIGGVLYTQQELLDIMMTPNAGDKTILMAFHLIATKLNVLSGSDPSALGSAIADADAWLANHGGVGSGQKPWDGGEAIKNTLDDYNNGIIGPGHCDALEDLAAGKGAVQRTGEAPSTHALNGNYPNPFNPETTINFSIEESAHVRLAVYDMLGRELEVLVDGVLNAGTYDARFDASDLPSGSYLYRLVTPTGTFTKMMMLLK